MIYHTKINIKILTGKGNLITSLYKRRKILQIKRLHRLVKYSTRHAFVGVVYIALALLVSDRQFRVVTPHTNYKNNIWYFDFFVDHEFTMMWYNHTNICDPQVNPVVMKDGILQRRITNRVCRERLFQWREKVWLTCNRKSK